MDNKDYITEWNGNISIKSIRMNTKKDPEAGNEDTIQRVAWHCFEHMETYPKVDDSDLEELFEVIMSDYGSDATKSEQKYGLMLGRHFHAKGYETALRKCPTDHHITVSKDKGVFEDNKD